MMIVENMWNIGKFSVSPSNFAIKPLYFHWLRYSIPFAGEGDLMELDYHT